MMTVIKKISYAFLSGLTLLFFYVWWLSPSLFGLIPGGKAAPSAEIYKLVFDKTPTGEYNIKYSNVEKDPELIELRRVFKLDTLLPGVKNDFEKIQRIQSWVHSRWKHTPDNMPEKRDAIYILKQAEKGVRYRCVEYAFVTAKCLQSFGFTCRTVGLKTKDINEVNRGAGHLVNEVYLPDLKKWFFIDPQNDIVITLNGVPLNGVEFQQAIVNKEPYKIINPSQVMKDDEYIKWVGPYLFYFTTSLQKGSESYWDYFLQRKKQLTLVPKGYEPPKFFQRLIRLTNETATNSEADFYPTL